MADPHTPEQNPFDAIPRLYDWEHDPFREDVDLYVALARRFGGPVLELACGTGRVLAPIAAAGIVCTGVDSSEPMLARAQARLRAEGLNATLLRQPLQALELAGLFRTILFPLDGLALLTQRAEQVAALTAARRHATHDARLILDLSNGNLRGGHEPPDELLHHLTALDPDSGRLITKWAVRQPNPAEQVDEILFLYDETDAIGVVHRTTTQIRLRWFTRFELELLLEITGWRIAELYGGYDLSPYGPTSERLLVVASPTSCQ